MDLPAIQAALRERNIDAWLFYDHHHRDPIAYRVLGLPAGQMVTRRWFYLIPASGDPMKLVHKIEPGHLDSLPGQQTPVCGLAGIVRSDKDCCSPNHRDIAMQYSPNNLVFTISLVDAGTIDLIRGLGKNVVSSGDLVAQFEATLTEEQIKSHFAARDAIDAITGGGFPGDRAGGSATAAPTNTRSSSGSWRPSRARIWSPTIRRSWRSMPTAAIRTTSLRPETSTPIREGDFVLLDVWAKKNTPGAVYYDITWTGFVGKSPSDRMREVFSIVRQARDVGVKTVIDGVSAGKAHCRMGS